MQHVSANRFWEVMEKLDAAPLGPRAVVEIDIQVDTTFTAVYIGGRVIGEEVSCHGSGNTRCYLADAAVA